jgi:hypothetical protein
MDIDNETSLKLQQDSESSVPEYNFNVRTLKSDIISG